MMTYILKTYNAKRELIMDQSGPKTEMRERGMRINEVRGQKTWVSELIVGGRCVATCKRGKWSEVDR